MKIVFSHKDLNFNGLGGGISRLYFELGKSLSKIGCQITFISANPEFKLDWANTIYIPYTKGEYQKYSESIAVFLKNYEFDIYECNIWRAEALEYAKTKNHKPIIVRGDLCSKQFGDNIQANRELQLMNLANTNISVSFAVSNYLRENYNSTSFVIWNGVDIEDFTFSLKKPTKNILWIGRPTTMKGFDKLEEIIKLMPDYSFDIVLGKGLDIIKFSEKMYPNTKIHSHLSSDELQKIFNRNSYVLSTSRFEGFGLSILEGMASGMVPIIPCDIGGTTEFVINNINGLVYERLSEIPDYLSKVNHQKLSKNAYKTAKNLSWERCALETLAYYKNTIKK